MNTQLGLVVELQLIAIDRASQFRLQRDAGKRRFPQLLFEEPVAATIGCLGVVERHRSIGEQCSRGPSVFGKHCDSHTGPYWELMAVYFERRRNDTKECFGLLRRAGGIRTPKNNRKLVILE